MPKYEVTVSRYRLETAQAYVEADEPNDIYIEEGNVLYANWIPSPDDDTIDFNIVNIEEIK